STRRWKAKSAAISPNGICFPVEHVTEYAGSRETRLTGSWRNLEQQARDALDSVNVELSGAKDELERIAEEKKGLETLKKEKTEVEIERMWKEVKSGKEKVDSELWQVKEVLELREKKDEENTKLEVKIAGMQSMLQIFSTLQDQMKALLQGNAK
ncbi:hypothetical protein Moror_3682, partial [Moniliophthora roreri MCA 2997]